MSRDFELSSYQQDILDYVAMNRGNLLIDAKAGSGKTSTLLLIADELIKAHKSCLFLSFNKSIVEELQYKKPELTGSIKTVHSLGWSFISNYLYQKHGKDNYKLETESGKLRTLCKAYYDTYFAERIKGLESEMSEQDLKALNGNLISDFVTICNFIRLYGMDYKDRKSIDYLTNRFCRDLYKYIDEDNLGDYWELVPAVLDKTIELFTNPPSTTPDGKPIYAIDFTDMIYFPVYFDMQIPFFIKNKIDTVLVDECIPDTHYIKTNKGKIKFRELKRRYDKNEDILVKTFNENTESFEYKSIVNIVNKGLRDVYEITTNGLNKIQATDNHPFMTQHGWKQLKDLNVGDDYLYLDELNNQKIKYIPNDDQLQIILGSAIGDGHLHSPNNYKNEYRITFVHGDAQLNYLKFKKDMLCCGGINSLKSGYKKDSKVNRVHSPMFILEYNTKSEIIKHLDLRGLSILYMDDGSKLYKYDYYGTRISCNSLTDAETELLVSKFAEYGIKCERFVICRKNKSYNEIKFNTENSKILFEKIAPYMHEDCFYKNPLSTGTYRWDYSGWKQFGGNIIKSIEYVGKTQVMDMEVQDNHNFLVSKTNRKHGSSIVVHNCQDLSQLQQLFIRKLNTGFNRFIYVRR